jgi:hypothetical protein
MRTSLASQTIRRRPVDELVEPFVLLPAGNVSSGDSPAAAMQGIPATAATRGYGPESDIAAIARIPKGSHSRRMGNRWTTRYSQSVLLQAERRHNQSTRS